MKRGQEVGRRDGCGSEMVWKVEGEMKWRGK